MADASDHGVLRRELGVFSATLLGLGSILGTGVFVSIGVAAGVAGPLVIVAIALAAAVATCNALSSAQLAASHPVSGGTYEYGYKYLTPTLGFSAGWMFLCAKSASAATAALGFAGYLFNAMGHAEPQRWMLVSLACATVVVFVLVVVRGIRQSNRVNIAIVSVTVGTLLLFVVCGLPRAFSEGRANLTDLGDTAAATDLWPALMQATALMFVAYTGYGRIATLGEEVREPRRTIPRAIGLTLWSSAGLYIAVAVVAIAAVGAASLGTAARTQAAPLEAAARLFNVPGIHVVVAIGAMTAMLGVLLNLLLGLSRVLLAMGRRRDMPGLTGRLNAAGTTPTVAVIVVGGIVLGLAMVGNVKTTWSFSAFTVLIYYAITNAAALRLSASDRLYPAWVSWLGLISCLGLAFAVERHIWLIGLAVLGAGLLWFAVADRLRRRRANP